MKPCAYSPGDKVDLSKWDAYERPVNRFMDSVVTKTERGICESGWMVTVKSMHRGVEMRVDQNWLRKK